MKITKFLISSFVLLGLFGLSSSFGQEIGFSYSSGDHSGKGCIVSVDIVMDAQGKQVSTTDIVMESSMTYVDFVPNKSLFPYYFPPVVRSNGLIHIVGFTALPEQVIIGSGTIGTLYFKASDTDPDASIRLYFLGSGNTTDTNLSFGGVDQLQKVNQAYFVMDQSPCTHEAAVISGGFAGMTYEDALTETVSQITDDYSSSRMKSFFVNNLTLIVVISLVVIALIVLTILYRKKIMFYIHKKPVGKKAIG